MEISKLKPALVSRLYDRVHVRPYGEGALVTTPFTYSDGDTVVVAVQPLGEGVRVTDREEAIDRLEDAGVDLERNARARQQRDALIRDARLIGLGAGRFELSHATDTASAAEAILRVAALAQQVEQLRYLAREVPHRLYRDVVQDDARAIAERHHWKVKSGAAIKLRSGSRRHVTARIQMDHETAYVQALSTTEAIASTFLTFYSFDVAPEAKLSVLDERMRTWPSEEIDALGDVSSLVRYRSESDLAVALERIDKRRPTVLT